MLSLTKSTWNANKEFYIWIFNVGRGFSSFIKTPHNFGMMVDCGASDDIRPFEHVVKPHFLHLLDQPFHEGRFCRLAQVIISHPHSDHCTEIENILDDAPPMLLTTPNSHNMETDLDQHVNWSLVKNPSGTETMIKRLQSAIQERKPPLKSHLDEPGFQVQGFDISIFFIPPAVAERNLPKADYTNNLSIVLYIATGGNSCLFMGDLLPSGCEWLLRHDAKFRQVVQQGLSVVVAPHHGLESGFCQSLYDAMPHGKVGTVHIISEKRAAGETEGKTHDDYQSPKVAFGYQGRYSLSTKNDGHIRVILGAGKKLKIEWSKDINGLLS